MFEHRGYRAYLNLVMDDEPSESGIAGTCDGDGRRWGCCFWGLDIDEARAEFEVMVDESLDRCRTQGIESVPPPADAWIEDLDGEDCVIGDEPHDGQFGLFRTIVDRNYRREYYDFWGVPYDEMGVGFCGFQEGSPWDEPRGDDEEPNEETIRAMRDVLEGRDLMECRDAAEMWGRPAERGGSEGHVC